MIFSSLGFCFKNRSGIPSEFLTISEVYIVLFSDKQMLMLSLAE